MVHKNELQTVLTLVDKDKREQKITLPLYSLLKNYQGLDDIRSAEVLRFLQQVFSNLSDQAAIKAKCRCHCWCEKHGWTDMFEESGRFYAFPPGAVIPIAIPEYWN